MGNAGMGNEGFVFHSPFLYSKFEMTLEPDGQAAGCNPAEVGSIPTGVSTVLGV
jgi:hypothetical protein